MKLISIIISTIFCIQLSFSQTNVTYDNLRIKEELFYNNQSGTASKKSVALASVLSLVMPGMGELYVGNYRTGRYLTGAEGALWLTYFSLDAYGNWLRDDGRRFAGMNAGVQLAGQNHQFFVNIGNYADVYQYNERKLQERQAEKLYDPNSIYYWKWNTDTERQKYKSQRIASDRAFNNTYFVLGAILANHLISAVNAGRTAVIQNRQQETVGVIEFETKLLGSFNKPDGLLLKISKTF